jgi:RNA polymerase sigma-70 factor (ECF subfamily)
VVGRERFDNCCNSGGSSCVLLLTVVHSSEQIDDLARRAQGGDRAALAVLVQAQQRYVYSIALGVMKEPADAADMTQEAFVRVMRSLHTYRGETRFTTWLYRLVTNVCLDGLRRRGRPVEPLDSAEDEGPPEVVDPDRWSRPDEQAELRESAAEVRAALADLPAAQRLALTLHYFEDMRYEDVAAVMNVPLNTAKSHIRRGKERLASLLRRPENGLERVACGAM